ncbi:MAG: extracellular solute-binding protein [Pirellulaceae bacterium]|nr:extracellular solute-binding protein [Pirellulaceae bacterium]
MLFLVPFCGCLQPSDEEVIVYTALDAEFSKPILDGYGKKSGLLVRPKFDTEATKTVGLFSAIEREKDRPRCDLFWNNEILHTLRLERLGLLDPYESELAENFPLQYRSPKGNWYGIAARARVYLVNTDLLPENEYPTTIHDLTNEKWKGRGGIAKPLFGTTATHAAVLFDQWGAEKAKTFFTNVKANAKVFAGNKQVAQAVANGQLAFGLTDTDDAIVEIEKGHPVAIVYLDQKKDEMGTLFIPNTLAVIQGAPHREQARKLLDYLLSEEVEQALAAGESAQFPLNKKITVLPRVAENQKKIKQMEVDFYGAANQWDGATAFLKGLFEGG